MACLSVYVGFLVHSLVAIGACNLYVLLWFVGKLLRVMSSKSCLAYVVLNLLELFLCVDCAILQVPNVSAGVMITVYHFLLSYHPIEFILGGEI